jgi:hypothetical protein
MVLNARSPSLRLRTRSSNVAKASPRHVGWCPNSSSAASKADYRSVWEFAHAEKLSFKKSLVAGERDRPDVARRHAQWTKSRSHRA